MQKYLASADRRHHLAKRTIQITRVGFAGYALLMVIEHSFLGAAARAALELPLLAIGLALLVLMAWAQVAIDQRRCLRVSVVATNMFLMIMSIAFWCIIIFASLKSTAAVLFGSLLLAYIWLFVAGVFVTPSPFAPLLNLVVIFAFFGPLLAIYLAANDESLSIAKKIVWISLMALGCIFVFPLPSVLYAFKYYARSRWPAPPIIHGIVEDFTAPQG